ncbi:MAG: hypothetical protein AVO33_10000 [delta proteobacterium ML8_F1]|nr:MAG: hypothetical protein AVO33_10000 [delta proteobacterium ML8_F1]
MPTKLDAKKIIFSLILGCLVMAWVELVLLPGYWIKSLIKLAVFGLIPIAALFTLEKTTLKNLFALRPGHLRTPLLIGLVTYGAILAAYFTLGPYFDLSRIPGSLEKNLGITKSNFIFVAFYIATVNSFLEEFYFRGFAYIRLRESYGEKPSSVYSATLFSLYHIAIMNQWFSPVLFILLLFFLLLTGFFFNWISRREGTFMASWIIHLFANLGINTVALFLF